VVVLSTPHPDSPGKEAFAQSNVVVVLAGLVVVLSTPHPDSPGKEAVAQLKGVDVLETVVMVVVLRTPHPDSPGKEALAQSNVVVLWTTPVMICGFGAAITKAKLDTATAAPKMYVFIMLKAKGI